MGVTGVSEISPVTSACDGSEVPPFGPKLNCSNAVLTRVTRTPALPRQWSLKRAVTSPNRAVSVSSSDSKMLAKNPLNGTPYRCSIVMPENSRNASFVVSAICRTSARVSAKYAPTT